MDTEKKNVEAEEEIGGEHGEERKEPVGENTDKRQGVDGASVKKEDVSNGKKKANESAEAATDSKNSRTKLEKDMEEDLMEKIIKPMSFDMDLTDFQDSIKNTKGNIQSKENFNVFKKV